MESIDLLQQLSDAFGVAGFEDEVRGQIETFISPYVDELRTDTLGNLIATRRGNSDLTLMLDAHMDEVGFMVKWIDNNGYLRFTPLGGWDERIIPGHRVEILSRSGEKHCGVIGSAPPHILTAKQRKEPIPIEKMFIDVGGGSSQEVADMGLRIGDPLTIHYPFTKLREGYVTGKAFDDRVGCVAMIQTACQLASANLNVNLVFAFVIGEEVGLRGARTAAYQINPDLALALEGTIGADMPGIPEENQPVRLGHGPAITVADTGIIVSPKLIKALEQTAEREAIPYQYKLPTYGGTDAGAIHLTREGIMAGVLSIPCRFIHSPTSTVRLNDLENTIQLLTHFIQDLPGALLQQRS